MNETKNIFEWDENFPLVYAHTSISFLKRCKGFGEAKNGDMMAATAVAEVCIKPQMISELEKRYPHAITIPIMTENKLPLALATAIGLKIYKDVCKATPVHRKKLTAMERLLRKPVFSGDILCGESYIIVDDVVTQGGTISSLRRHILASGGKVEAVVSLACAAGSRALAPTRQDILTIIEKFELNPIITVLRQYNIADSLYELTQSQIKYLLKFSTIHSLANYIAKVSAI